MLSCTFRGPALFDRVACAKCPRVSPFSHSWRRRASSLPAQLADHPDFDFYPHFFSQDEQRVLLRAALRKLDAQESPKHRRKRKDYLRTLAQASTAAAGSDPVQSLFLPDEYYAFQDARLSPTLRPRGLHGTLLLTHVR